MLQLRDLPSTGPWEVELVDVPGMKIEGTELEGILLVAEPATGLVRHIQPIPRGQDPGQGLLLAASAPAPPSAPGRPTTIRCREALAPRLFVAGAALGAGVEARPSLPLADHAATSLLVSMSGGLPSDPAPWAPLLQELVREAPWKEVPDSVHFRCFEGPPLLKEAVGLVLGQAGTQAGFVLYPTQGDFAAFSAMIEAGRPVPGTQFTCWCAHLDPLVDFPERTQGMLQSAGLARDGLGLRLFVMDGFESRSLRRDEEAAFLAALKGMLVAWSEHGVALNDGPQATRVVTEVGELRVFSVPMGRM